MTSPKQNVNVTTKTCKQKDKHTKVIFKPNYANKSKHMSPRGVSKGVTYVAERIGGTP